MDIPRAGKQSQTEPKMKNVVGFEFFLVWGASLIEASTGKRLFF